MPTLRGDGTADAVPEDAAPGFVEDVRFVDSTSRGPVINPCTALTGVALTSVSIAVCLALQDVIAVGRRPHLSSNTTAPAPVPLISVARWCCAPVAAVAAAFLIALRPEAVLHRVPSMFASYLERLHRVLPLHPKNERAAFHIGIAYNVLVGEGDVQRALQLAELAAGRAVTEAELRSLPQRLPAALEVRNEVLGAFTLVNTMWVVAIAGLAVTAGPFAHVVSKPLRELLVELWALAIEFLVLAHERMFPLYEVLAYAAACYLVVECTRYARSSGKPDPYATTGVMMGVSAVAVFSMAWLHTTSKNRRDSGDYELFLAVSWTLVGLFCVPIAMVHQSKLLGYVAVASFAVALGFSAYSTGLCIALGFGSHDGLMRAAVGCGAMAFAALLLRGVRVANRWVRPLEEPLGVIGTSVYLLALSIHMGMFGSARSHVFYIANVVALTVAGRLVGLPGAANVGTVYGALFAFTLFCEYRPRYGDASIVWHFVLFAILYGASLFLSRHPALLVSMFTGGMS